MEGGVFADGGGEAGVEGEPFGFVFVEDGFVHDFEDGHVGVEGGEAFGEGFPE